MTAALAGGPTAPRADAWLSAAPGPHASTAAIQRPPDRGRCGRPRTRRGGADAAARETRCAIAARDAERRELPAATTPCCAAARSAIARSAGAGRIRHIVANSPTALVRSAWPTMAAKRDGERDCTTIAATSLQHPQRRQRRVPRHDRAALVARLEQVLHRVAPRRGSPRGSPGCRADRPRPPRPRPSRSPRAAAARGRSTSRTGAPSTGASPAGRRSPRTGWPAAGWRAPSGEHLTRRGCRPARRPCPADRLGAAGTSRSA